MAPLLTLDVETDGLIAALDHLSTTVLEQHTKPAALTTANHIAAEAQRRVARRTGKTAEGIHVEEDYARVGYVVLATRNPFPNLPLWLEEGTVRMSARPFFYASAALEADAHDTRMRAAIQAAIDEVGLGA